MSGSKYIDRICIIAISIAVIVSFVFLYWGTNGFITLTGSTMMYEDKLFDTSYVHHVDIVVNNKDEFLDQAESKEYWTAKIVIDGRSFGTVGIRTKGFASLYRVLGTDDEKYSLKIQFDKYNKENTYYGLDKLDLNNMALDPSCMRDYISYQIMRDNGVPAPLCSYTEVTLNGESLGLYLAVEDIEDAFVDRNSLEGEIYKPQVPVSVQEKEEGDGNEFVIDIEDNRDARLTYIDDDISSYPNIFDYAKTDVDEEDQERLIESIRKLNEYKDLDEVLDVPEVISYFAVNNFVLPTDSYTGSLVRNYYLLENEGQLSMIPWDYDSAFGANYYSSVDKMASLPIDEPFGAPLNERPMMAWIFSDDEYVQAYYDDLTSISEQVQSGVYADEVDRIAEMIRPYVLADPHALNSSEDFETAVHSLKKFMTLRAQDVLKQINDQMGSTYAEQGVNQTTLSTELSQNEKTTDEEAEDIIEDAME